MNKTILRKFIFLLSLVMIVLAIVLVMIESHEGIMTELAKYLITLGIAAVIAVPMFFRKKNDGHGDYFRNGRTVL